MKINKCEFHEICDKCGNPEVRGLKNFPKGTNNPKPTEKQFLGYSPDGFKRGLLENRIKRKWSVKKMLETPTIKKFSH